MIDKTIGYTSCYAWRFGHPCCDTIESMTKGQAWVLIIGVFILIALFMIRNGNEAQSAVNKMVACDDICYNSFKDQSSKSYTNESILSECLNQCKLNNL